MRKKQGYNARLDESLGEHNRKKSPASKTKRTTKRAVTLSPDINQHKRMAMGENVLTGKMIKRAKGGMAGRRKESEGMEKAKGRRKYAAVGTMDKGKKTAPVKKRRGGTAAPGTASRRAALARHQKRQNRFVRPQLSEGMKSGGTVKKTKQRGGRTAADSARAAARTHPRGSWATRLPRSLLKKGGRAPATTGVKLNMGAPKVKTITARGMGAALRGGQFRENT